MAHGHVGDPVEAEHALGVHVQGLGAVGARRGTDRLVDALKLVVCKGKAFILDYSKVKIEQ